jgi:hypothetical protein
MQFETGDLARHRGIAEAAFVVDELDQTGVAVPSIEAGGGSLFRYLRVWEYLLVAITCDNALQIIVGSNTKIIAV